MYTHKLFTIQVSKPNHRKIISGKKWPEAGNACMLVPGLSYNVPYSEKSELKDDAGMTAICCPNDKHEMGAVKAESHYGWPVIIEQCPECGGLWFDMYELYSVKPGQAEKIEQLNAEIFVSPASSITSPLLCPRDGASLTRFASENFPEEVVVARCPRCGGFWLNRGEFTRYQKARGGAGRTHVSPTDEEAFRNEIKAMLAKNKDSNPTGVLSQLGQFLNTQVDPVSMRPLDPESMPPGQECAFERIMDILSLIFRLFIFKGGF